jgi:hypothetical protein
MMLKACVHVSSAEQQLAGKNLHLNSTSNCLKTFLAVVWVWLRPCSQPHGRRLANTRDQFGQQTQRQSTGRIDIFRGSYHAAARTLTAILVEGQPATMSRGILPESAC